MRPNKVKAIWREGRPATAGWLSTGNTYVAEAMANAGFDALVIDMQHGMGVDVAQAVACLQAISTTEITPMVRVPWNDPIYIQYVLDAGAYGVIVPLVNSYEEATKAGGACRYAPLGYRSVGPNRARFYAGADYIQHANEEVICLVQVETVEAVNRLEEIAEAPGIDGFYIGPADLALSLGIPPEPDNKDPRHMAACQRVHDVAKAKGLIPAIHVSGPEEAGRRFDQGFMFCPLGSDISFVQAGSQASLKALRGAMAKR
ncbi:MAG: 2,4-dihydroxyhept-2-ene-1,7-dioic acid aldolase [Chloroflexi bacterium]|nr:2,4-dihydroxyhept-2-ene-1,7-dioic acid aldolase [Chloroflexota bacterium]